MRSTIEYEWDYETVEDGDIIDHNPADSLASFTDRDRTNTLVLIRHAGNEVDGLVDRSWAYVENGRLPEYFTDSAGCKITLVPKRFHIELSNHLI